MGSVEQCLNIMKAFILSLPMAFSKYRATMLSRAEDFGELDFLDLLSNGPAMDPEFLIPTSAETSLLAVFLSSGWFGLPYEIEAGRRVYSDADDWVDISDIYR